MLTQDMPHYCQINSASYCQKMANLLWIRTLQIITKFSMNWLTGCYVVTLSFNRSKVLQLIEFALTLNIGGNFATKFAPFILSITFRLQPYLGSLSMTPFPQYSN